MACGKFGFPQSGATFGESEAPASDLLLLGSVHKMKEFLGKVDLGIRAGEGEKGDGLGAVEGRGVEVARLEGDEEGGRLGFVVVLREDMASVVHAQGALAGGEVEFLVDEQDDGGVGAIFVVEPEVEALALVWAQASEPGIAAQLSAAAGFAEMRHHDRRLDC